MPDYFSDREHGPRPRVSELIEQRLWAAIRSLVDQRVDDGSFGFRFPEICSDAGKRPFGCNEQAFAEMLQAEVPGLEWPLRQNDLPATTVILDLLEFSAKSIGTQQRHNWHEFFDHYHVSWMRQASMPMLRGVVR